MAFADFDWATDANYPAGAATWSGTATKVAPSAGVQADGFTPEDQPPAQWINWLFNGIIEAGQTLEALVGDGTLQKTFENSVVATVAEIDPGTDSLDIAGVVFDADGMTIATGDLTVSNPPTLQSALVVAPTTGAVSMTELSDGLWTPVIKAVTGTNVDIADFTGLGAAGTWSRVGEIVTFAFHATVDTTSWSGTATFTVDLPVAGTSTRLTAVMTTTQVCESTDADGAGGTSDAIFTLNGALGSVGTGRRVSVFGQYRLA